MANVRIYKVWDTKDSICYDVWYGTQSDIELYLKEHQEEINGYIEDDLWFVNLERYGLTAEIVYHVTDDTIDDGAEGMPDKHCSDEQCPEDADEIKHKVCGARSPTDFICTRIKGHDGLHHAHAGRGHCCDKW